MLFLPLLPLSHYTGPCPGKTEGISGPVPSCHTQFLQPHFEYINIKLSLMWPKSFLAPAYEEIYGTVLDGGHHLDEAGQGPTAEEPSGSSRG